MKRLDYSLKHRIDAWAVKSISEQKGILQDAADAKGGAWYYVKAMKSLIEQAGQEHAEMLFRAFVKNVSGHNLGRDRDVSDLMSTVAQYCNVDTQKATIRLADNQRVYRLFALLPGELSTSDESLLLRGISYCKYAPDYIHSNQYRPTVEALDKLPPVTRLKTFEALTRDKTIGYDIFSNISEDELEPLLFGSVLRHRDRVEKVWKDVKYFKSLSNESTVAFQYDCDVCGKYEVKVRSHKIHTVDDLVHTGNARMFGWQSCMFCRRKLLGTKFLQDG